MNCQFLIDEEILGDGSYQRTYLRADDAEIVFRDESGLEGTFAARVIVSVIARYGHPLDDAVMAGGPILPIGDEAFLQVLRFRARVDVEARHYVVLTVENQEPIAALSRVVAGALRYLAKCQKLATSDR